MALKMLLEGTRINRKCDPYLKITPSSLKVVASGKKCPVKSNTKPSQALQILQVHQMKKGVLN